MFKFAIFTSSRLMNMNFSAKDALGVDAASTGIISDGLSRDLSDTLVVSLESPSPSIFLFTSEVDVWSTAVSIYEMYTGEVLFESLLPLKRAERKFASLQQVDFFVDKTSPTSFRMIGVTATQFLAAFRRD